MESSQDFVLDYKSRRASRRRVGACAWAYARLQAVGIRVARDQPRRIPVEYCVSVSCRRVWWTRRVLIASKRRVESGGGQAQLQLLLTRKP